MCKKDRKGKTIYFLCVSRIDHRVQKQLQEHELAKLAINDKSHTLARNTDHKCTVVLAQ